MQNIANGTGHVKAWTPNALMALLVTISFGSGSASAEVAQAQFDTNAPPLLALNFKPNLPVVILEAKGQIDHAQKTPCIISIIDPKGRTVSHSNAWPAVVKIHGGVSQGYPKKSYGLTLAAPARLLDLRESPHWMLNAAFIDRSLMRHKVSYDLFRSLPGPAAHHAVASRFVEVSLNGDSQGAYLLMERLDRELLELRPFRSNELRHACIYKAVDHAANFSQPGHGGYEQREPDPLAHTYWQPLDEFDQFVSSSTDADFFDPEQGITSRLDVDNAMDFHLLVLLTCNLDGITKNFILARNGSVGTADPPRFFFAPWDYDGTFGRNWDASPVAPTEWPSNHLFDRLMGNRAYQARFARRWKQLRAREFSVQIVQEMIEANARALGEAARRNANRWGGAAAYYPDKLAFGEDVKEMKAWLEIRAQWLDGEIQRRTAPPQ